MNSHVKTFYSAQPFSATVAQASEPPATSGAQATPKPKRVARYLSTLAVTLVFMSQICACGSVAPVGDDAAEPEVTQQQANLSSGFVSFKKPDGLILSTGNLYFTSHNATSAAVYRMAQSANPGQEILLYSEPGAVFGDIVFAQVGGAFFGYFFVQNASGLSIKRVPLPGGPAITITPITNVDIRNSHRNLVTDGINLYWQDVSAIRKVPIGGGAITILDATSPNTPTAGISLSNNNIYYAAGSAIRYVPTSGAITSPLFRTVTTAAARVTALWTVANGIYWGEINGAVRLRVGGVTTTLSGDNGMVPTSIATNGYTAGAAQVWTACTSSACRLFFDFPAGRWSSAIAADALGAAVTSSGNVYWGDAGGVHRQVF